jgi:hypothetical protein
MKTKPDKTLHPTAIRLRFMAAGELGRQAATSSGPMIKGNRDRLEWR